MATTIKSGGARYPSRPLPQAPQQPEQLPDQPPPDMELPPEGEMLPPQEGEWLPDEPVMTIADEQRARSLEIEAMGVEEWKNAHDERNPDETQRQVEGVTSGL
jgi:hypothetical protein